MKTLIKYLLKEDTVIFFDVDGVLAPYEFGENRHYCNKHYTIYCPKCKLEYIDIHEYEWKELQLDMEYHNNE